MKLKPRLYCAILSSPASLPKGLVRILKCDCCALDSCDSGGPGGGILRGGCSWLPNLFQSLREEAYADGSGPRAISGPPALESQPLTGLFFWRKKWLNVGSHRKYFLKFYLWLRWSLIFSCLQYLLCFLITVLTLECLNCFLVKLKLWNSDFSLSKK